MNVETIHSTQFIEEVIQHNVNKNLIRYNLFMKSIMGQSEYLLEKELATSAYEQSKRIPIGALAAVFSDPTFSYWTYLSSCIKKRMDNGEEIPNSDLPYLAGLSTAQPGKGLYYHLLELNRFLVAASFLARIDIKAQVNFLEDRLYVPILGIYFEGFASAAQPEVDFKMEGDRAWMAINGREISDFEAVLFAAEKGVSTVSQPQEGVFIQASILGSNGKIILDRLDPFLRLGWSTLYKNPDGSGYLSITSSEMEEELSVIFKAYGLIQEHWPEIESHVGTSIRTIHLVKSPYVDRHMSCTSEQFFGSILTSTGDEYQLAEAIVHEYSHNLLNMVILSGEIFEGQVPREETYYSPWREDPRPIAGVLHAVFVFVNVSELLERVSNSIPEVSYLNVRKIDNLIRLRTGLMVLKEFPFTRPFAVALIADLEQKISRLEQQYAAYDYSDSLALQKVHLEKWCKANKDLSIPESIRVKLGV
jgi:HEXXH motif-containing protein